MSVAEHVKPEFARDLNDNHVDDDFKPHREATSERSSDRITLVVPEPKRLSPHHVIALSESRSALPQKDQSVGSPGLSPNSGNISQYPWQLPFLPRFPHYPFIPYPGLPYPMSMIPEQLHSSPYLADYMKYLPNIPTLYSPSHLPPFVAPFHVAKQQEFPAEADDSKSGNLNHERITEKENVTKKEREINNSPVIRTPTVYLDKNSVSDDKKTEREVTQIKYRCDSCNKSYSTYSGLSKHKQFHCTLDLKEFTCKYCEKTYVSLGALKMHIRTHTLPCKCKICGKAFSRPWLLQGHVRTHTGEKPFTCVHCLRAFADRSNLRAHLQTHSDVKKYSCRSCSKTFSRMSLLMKHEDTCRNVSI